MMQEMAGFDYKSIASAQGKKALRMS